MAEPNGRPHTGAVGRGLTAQRVLRDVDVIARAGLETGEFLEEALASVTRAVPHLAACVANLDPSTHLNTGAHKFGDLRDRDGHDREWGLLEFQSGDPLAIAELARRDDGAVGVQSWNAEADVPTTRLEAFMLPHFGYADELRVVLSDRREVWGGLSLFRGAGEPAFDADEVALMSDLAPSLAVGMRTGLLARLVSVADSVPAGPAVIVVGADNTIRQVSAGASARIDELLSASITEPMGTIAALVGAARGFAAGTLDRPPRCRVRGRSGMWLALHATCLVSADGSSGDVVVTIDEARPPEIVPLVVAAFDLTPRERDVALLVLQGVETKEMAARLHLSAYTVQDHLKSVFDKAGVRSRRELVARVYFDQYVPRLGTELGPTGWFASG
jgi:DNA-binding CsgD family transcriptional regulator